MSTSPRSDFRQLCRIGEIERRGYSPRVSHQRDAPPLTPLPSSNGRLHFMIVERLASLASMSDERGAVARFVLEHGKAFVPVALPRGVRKRAPGKCFEIATKLALNGSGFSYVEGFACHRSSESPLIHHAWITTDGIHAVDPSAQLCATNGAYFGVAFPLKSVAGLMLARGYYGVLNPVDATALSAGCLPACRITGASRP